MPALDIDALISDYAQFIKSEITVERFGEYYELTTPYLDRHNDYLQIYVKQEQDGKIRMTDDGATIGDLFLSGMPIGKGTVRRKAIESIVRVRALSLEGERIVANTTRENFPLFKHLMVQAMVEIGDLYVTKPGNVKSMFVEDVQAFLDKNSVIYVPNFSTMGKSGRISVYPFVVPKTKARDEWFISAVNNLNKSSGTMQIFNWIDTREARKKDSSLMVMINDSNKMPKEELDAFRNYNIVPIPFKERELALDLLGAAS